MTPRRAKNSAGGFCRACVPWASPGSPDARPRKSLHWQRKPMRRDCLLIACLLLTGRLAAWGGSTETWLEGTQPWDTTPMNEVDLQVLGSGGDGHGLVGPGAQWGILDELQASGTYEWPVHGGKPASVLGLRLRERVFPDLRRAFSVYGRAPYIDGTWSGWGGVAADWEPLESDLALNAEMGDGGR